MCYNTERFVEHTVFFIVISIDIDLWAGPRHERQEKEIMEIILFDY